MGKLSFFLIFIFFSAKAQDTFSISGTVNDKQGHPVPGATVFIAGTKTGTAADNLGKFILNGLTSGNYELVITMIGFAPARQNFRIQYKDVNTIIQLLEDNKMLNEVKIKDKPKPKPNARDLKDFTENFIGRSNNATQCKILNPQVLNFNHPRGQYELDATADDFLIIENDALGYRLKYLLKKFILYHKYDVCYYDGSPYFEELEGTAQQQQQWDANRRMAYLGSARNFFRTIMQGASQAAGFYTNKINTDKNARFPLKLINIDSMLTPVNKNFKVLASGQSTAKLPSSKKENPDLYIYYIKTTHDDDALTWVKQIDGTVMIDKNGGIAPGGCEFFNGYYGINSSNRGITPGVAFSFWGRWATQRIADLTPLDYFVEPVIDSTTLKLAGASDDLKSKMLQNIIPLDSLKGRTSVYGIKSLSIVEPYQNSALVRSNLAADMQGDNVKQVVPTALNNLTSKINWYGIKNQLPVLFVHFDKNVYTNNEKVWFTGYLLNATNEQQYNLLSLALVRDDDRSVVLDNKFLIKDGLSFGDTIIPDSIPPGNYSFTATTNRLKNGRPEVVFTQPITIKTEDAQTYAATLNPLDTSVTAQQQKVMLLVNFINDPKPPASIPATYYVGNTANPVLRGFVKTKAGQYVFIIPSGMLNQGNNTLHVQVRYKGENKTLSIALPARQELAKVAFYPEGGNLVNSIQSTIGWEVKSASGSPLGVSAVLYEDKKAIDTITTNSYGMGKFTLTPKEGSSYAVKLYKVNKTDTLYQLPTALLQGPILSLTNAVVNDTLTVNLKDENREKLYLIGHNYKQLFFATPVIMNIPSKRIKFIIKDIPKGLTQLTLTDSTGRPFAERTFFAHDDRRESIQITTDKTSYQPREKVNVQIKLNTNLPADGYVSVACVQENRVEIKKKNDIESYFYLKHDLGDLPVRDTYLSGSEADKQFLENILLIKGWSRYKWTDVLKVKPVDTMNHYEDIAFKGKVTEYEKPLDKPVNLINMTRPPGMIATDKTGAFTLNNADLLVDSGKRAMFEVNEPDPKLYSIKLEDPYMDINELVAAQLEPGNYNIAGYETTSALQLADNEHAIHLKEVKIKGENDDAFYGVKGRDIENALEIGKLFTVSSVIPYSNKREYSFKIYAYVDEFLPYKLRLTGIDAAREFYVEDQSKTNPSEPEYLSTLYWKHLVKVSSVKDSALSFYTGDIAGRFKIIVQGITVNDVTYGETMFNVIKPK